MERRVPFLDMKSPYIELKQELDQAYQRVMESGWYILGQEVEQFELEFASYCGAAYCVGVGNGLEDCRVHRFGLLRSARTWYAVGPEQKTKLRAHLLQTGPA